MKGRMFLLCGLALGMTGCSHVSEDGQVGPKQYESLDEELDAIYAEAGFPDDGSDDLDFIDQDKKGFWASTWDAVPSQESVGSFVGGVVWVGLDIAFTAAAFYLAFEGPDWTQDFYDGKTINGLHWGKPD